jgi:hypothetical protein
MKKIIILSMFLLSACNPYKGDSEIENRFTPTVDSITELNNQFLQLKNESLIKENDFSTTEGLMNGASIYENELILDNTLNLNQHLDTGVNLKDLNSYSLSVWFKTLDVNRIQMVFWQGVSSQNGWGNGSDNPAFSELNLALNHWNNTLGNSINAFYGYNEGSLITAPVSFPMRLNTVSSTYDMLGNPFIITNNYTHLVITVSKTSTDITIKVYANGDLIDEGVGAQIDSSQWNSNLLLGKAGANGQRNFYGSMKKFLSFNKALTDEEVSLIYQIQR